MMQQRAKVHPQRGVSSSEVPGVEATGIAWVNEALDSNSTRRVVSMLAQKCGDEVVSVVVSKKLNGATTRHQVVFTARSSNGTMFKHDGTVVLQPNETLQVMQHKRVQAGASGMFYLHWYRVVLLKRCV